ncbi:hypothetical protein EVA_22375, partial [gut metagenome]
MTANGCVPLAWLNVFPLWTLLEVEITLPIEHMKVDYWMQGLTPPMTNT